MPFWCWILNNSHSLIDFKTPVTKCSCCTGDNMPILLYVTLNVEGLSRRMHFSGSLIFIHCSTLHYIALTHFKCTLVVFMKSKIILFHMFSVQFIVQSKAHYIFSANDLCFSVILFLFFAEASMLSLHQHLWSICENRQLSIALEETEWKYWTVSFHQETTPPT